jgi:hypothetical protein
VKIFRVFYEVSREREGVHGRHLLLCYTLCVHRAFTFSIGMLVVLSLINSAVGTETLDCSSDKYLIRLAVGSECYFGEVLLYQNGKPEYISIPKEKFRIAVLNWKKKKLKLEYVSASNGLPSFEVNVNGSAKGFLQIDGKKYIITCGW